MQSPSPSLAPQDSAARILDAAERCMQRYGLRRVSMADVAAEAGMSRGSVYRWYGDRSVLVDAVLARTADRFVAASGPEVDRQRTLADQAGAAAAFIVAQRRDEDLTLTLPGERDSLLATVMTAGMTALVDRWVAFWRPRLADAAGRGELRPGLDHGRAAEWIVRLLLSFALMPSVVVDLDDSDAVRSLVRDHLVHGFA